jgi:SAM-dependent methyltransferase
VETQLLPKPVHLGDEYAAQFSDPSVVAAYPHRLPYPPATFAILAGLITATPRIVLDIGCGTGDVARNLTPLVERVDAVDISAPMIELGRTLPGGDDPRLRWILGRAEEAALDPAYALVTAGESLHWMDWGVLMPRLRALLVPGGVLAIVDRGTLSEPWRPAMQALFPRYSTNRDFQPYELVDELVRRGLFTPLGEASTEPVEHRQPIAAYVESFHSRNGFSRDRMAADEAAAFDNALTELVAPHADDGELILGVAGRVRWGRPGG